MQQSTAWRFLPLTLVIFGVGACGPSVPACGSEEALRAAGQRILLNVLYAIGENETIETERGLRLSTGEEMIARFDESRLTVQQDEDPNQNLAVDFQMIRTQGEVQDGVVRCAAEAWLYMDDEAMSPADVVYTMERTDAGELYVTGTLDVANETLSF